LSVKTSYPEKVSSIRVKSADVIMMEGVYDGTKVHLGLLVIDRTFVVGILRVHFTKKSLFSASWCTVN